MNYFHHNPIKHGYVSRWQDWPYSSAAIYLKEMGRDEAERKWREFPLLDYGEGWDDPEM
jgi:putative transposase